MTTIPTINFDYFNLPEIPTFILCNPDETSLYALGGISERKISVKFNALSELSFRADEYINETKMPYYDYLVNRRLIYIENVGYFVITESPETNNGIETYKEIKCESREVELSSKKLLVYISGSSIDTQEPTPVYLEDLLDDLIERFIPDWSWKTGSERMVLTEIPNSGGFQTFTMLDWGMPEKYAKYGAGRSFDVGETSIYNFLMTSVEEAYGCTFDFDTINKKILIYDPDEIIARTDIYISHDNLIENLEINEITDELATCLYVYGGGNLGIINVNPLGNNYVYNFDYFTNSNWMEADLITGVNSWLNHVEFREPSYKIITQSLYETYVEQAENNNMITFWSGSVAYYQQMIDTGLYAPGLSLEQIQQLLAESQSELDDYEAIGETIETEIISWTSQKNSIIEECSMTTFLSASYVSMLQPFVIQSSYINDNIIEGESMSASSIWEQSDKLYNQGKDVLKKISEPRYSFEIDSVNFMQIQDFQTYRDQIVLGASINIELKEGISTSPILLQMDMGFDDPTDFKLIFGNRTRLDNDAFIFGDLMNKALDAGTTNRINKQSWNSWTRIYQDQFSNLLTGVNVSSPNLSEGMQVNQGNINLITPDLLWNGVPIATAIGGGTSGEMNITITLFSGGSVAAMYDPTAAGLNEAIAASQDGDTIFMPDVDISGNFTLTRGVSLVGVSKTESILRGRFTADAGCLLQNLYLINERTDDTGITTFYAQDTLGLGNMIKVNNCEIYCYQCGSGSTIAVYIDSSWVDLEFENSIIVSDSAGGLGYTFVNNGGYCKVYHSNYYGKTEVFYDL